MPSYAPPGAATDSAWRRMTGALPYGYGLYYAVRIEGIPTIFLELASDAVAPTSYDLDASLVIDRSARLGCLVDGDSAIAKGFDLELRLLPSTAVDAYFTRPQRSTRLTTALTSSATLIYVDDARPFDGLSEVYFGTSCTPLSAQSDGVFTASSRTVYGRARSYPVGTLVTDGPSVWQGRRVDLFAVLLDPAGSYVQSSDILDYAVMIWSGYVATRPERDGTEWVMMVRDQIRRVADPIGVAASGTAVWTDDDDGLVPVPTAMRYICKVDLQPSGGTGTILDVNIRPFPNYTAGDTARSSRLRTNLVDEMTSAATIANPGVASFVWIKKPVDAARNVWELAVNFNPAVGDIRVEVMTTYADGGGEVAGFFARNGLTGDLLTGLRDSTAMETRPLGLYQMTNVNGVALAVILDEGDPADLPTSGMVVLEAAGVTTYAEYTALEVDDADPALVHLTLDTTSRIAGAELDAIFAGERQSVSVRFLWTDSGQIGDILQRALASTGDGVNGANDTLPKGQGLGLPALDEDSFDDTFAGVFADLDFQIYTDSGSSIGDIFGGVLRLARMALVSRRTSDGASVDVAAVDVGSVDTGVPVAVITDAILVASKGRRPVRVKTVYTAPQVIECKVRSAPIDDIPEAESAITFKDPHLVDWTSEKWDLDIYGLDRVDLQSVGWGWALSWFRSGETRQVVEIDVPPWVDAQAGQVVWLDLRDASLWDYAQGVAGLTGFGRVLGEQMNLGTAITTLTVACDGIYTAGPMCPSLGIVAVNGGATTPTSIDVAEELYDLLVAAKDDEASWTVLCYVAGVDGARASYTVSTVALTGGVCRLTVTAYPSSPAVSLDTTYLLTWPVSASSTDNQGRYLHTDDGRQWS